MKRLLAVAASLLLALAAAPATAQERIQAYHADITVLPDGSMEVTENITVRALGNRIRRGIYRDFPTRYKDRHGNRYVVDFEVLEVRRDGQPEPWFTEKRPNGVRVNTGNDDFLPVPADIRFSIRYRTSRQLGFFDEHDELYWNVTGLGWDFVIEKASARVTLPAPVPADALRLDAYTGPQGSRQGDYRARVPGPGVAEFEALGPLGSYEGLTVVVGFPKGLVVEPSRAQRLGWLLRDNGGVLVALAGLLVLLPWYLLSWHRVGRDPAPGSIFPRYESPEGFSPGELRYLWKQAYTDRCFAADIVDLAVHGHVVVHQEGKKDWVLERLANQAPAPSEGQRVLMEKLFSEGERVELKNTNASVIGGARMKHMVALHKRMHPTYFKRNGLPLLLGWLFSFGYGALAFLVAGGSGLPLIIGLLVLTLVAHMLFGWLMKAPTPTGRALLDEIEGLRMYLGVAERDELARLAKPGGPEAPLPDPARYQALLPYALALDVEEAWTKHFTAAVGAAQAEQTARSMGWYRGSTASMASLGAMSSSLGSALSSQISSSASPPGSSSGGGGGGSSGGGGGGGGGGGR
ncbi:DUF2207 domain-containing protein [Arenimonas donghaensis]|uniref:DUF2207 domain-containing protein n=1 Tax=Arenimonas donghaensis DSM 18148 = HO3-R19 TaxID=1121014 RepID=A0A087MHJ1_9GAMM|nr:DUF2207 domain-containing protein [Arenimonas donghaensis]KFL36344.1 hypothetical protein N788_13565 [Arenimonas donghaensis DSM 18148 = HO3-R19]